VGLHWRFQGQDLGIVERGFEMQLNDSKQRYLIIGAAWIFVLTTLLLMFHGLYKVVDLSASNPNGLMTSPGNLLQGVEFVYDLSLVVICLFFGLGLLRPK
jgi:hypothetical protein